MLTTREAPPEEREVRGDESAGPRVTEPPDQSASTAVTGAEHRSESLDEAELAGRVWSEWWKDREQAERLLDRWHSCYGRGG